MSGKDEKLLKDFPLCKKCLDCSEFWYYDNPVNDEKNIFFNPEHWLGNRPSVIIYDTFDGWERECTLKELDAIGDGNIYCSNCDGKASEEVKNIIIRIAKCVVIEYKEMKTF